MMLGLTANVKEVRDDIGEVKKDPGEQISQGRKETEELKRRLDDQDNAFEDRVAGVIQKLGLMLDQSTSADARRHRRRWPHPYLWGHLLRPRTLTGCAARA